MKNLFYLFLFFFVGLECNPELIKKSPQNHEVIIVSLDSENKQIHFELPYLYSEKVSVLELSEGQKGDFLKQTLLLSQETYLHKPFQPKPERRSIFISNKFKNNVSGINQDKNKLIKYYLALYKLICEKFGYSEGLENAIANSKISFVPFCEAFGSLYSA